MRFGTTEDGRPYQKKMAARTYGAAKFIGIGWGPADPTYTS
jgi:hypothetical protein